MINTEYVYTYHENSNNSKKCEVSVKAKGTDKGMFNYPVGLGKTLEEAKDDFIHKMEYMEAELIHLCVLLHDDEIEDIVEVGKDCKEVK